MMRIISPAIAGCVALEPALSAPILVGGTFSSGPAASLCPRLRPTAPAARLVPPGNMLAVAPLLIHADTKPEATQKRVLDLTAHADDYRVVVRDGLFYRPDGSFWDTHGRQAKFIMAPDGRLFASVKFRGQDGRGLHHSSFTGAPVAAAGLLNVRQGRLLYAICESGHYEPTPAMMAQFLARIGVAGVSLHTLRVGYHLSDAKADTQIVWYRGDHAAASRAQHTLHMNPAQQVGTPDELAPPSP